MVDFNVTITDTTYLTYSNFTTNTCFTNRWDQQGADQQDTLLGRKENYNTQTFYQI